MKIALHVLAYDVDRTINSMLRNAGPWVDKIYVAYPPRPFDYILSSRDTRTNPTQLESIHAGEFQSKVEVIQGDWKKEEDTRNTCLEKAKQEGFDWLIIQDADEFYTEASWERLRGVLARHTDIEAYRTTWFNFWKSSHFVIEDRSSGIKETNAGFALRCAPHLNFTNSRITNATHIAIIDEPCYHYGYVKSDTEMFEKVTTWSHAHQFDGPTWYRLKWKTWNRWTENIAPVHSRIWRRAIRFPYHQPDFAHEFALPVDYELPKPLSIRMEEALYDQKALARSYLRYSLRGRP